MTFQNGGLFWREHKSLDDSLSLFAANLPSFASPALYQDRPAVSDVELASIHIMMHAATVHLHRDFMDMLPASYNKCIVAANAMTSIIRELGELDYDYLDPIVSVSASVSRLVQTLTPVAFRRVSNAAPMFICKSSSRNRRM